jgi:hypothetical protein
MAPQANPVDIHEHYEKQLKDLQEAYGGALLELCGRQKFRALLGEPLSSIGDSAVFSRCRRAR